MPTTRHYIVTNTTTQIKRLIEATSQAQARAHAARHLFTAEIAKVGEVVELMQAGVTPERAIEAQEATQEQLV